MADYRSLLLFLLLSPLVPTLTSGSVLLDLSNSSIPFYSGNASHFDNESSLYPLTNVSTAIPASSNVSTKTHKGPPTGITTYPGLSPSAGLFEPSTTNLVSNGSQDGFLTSVLSSPVSISVSSTPSLPMSESRNNITSRPPYTKVTNLSVSNETYISLKNYTEGFNHDLAIVSSTLNVSNDSVNGSLRAYFPNSSKGSVDTHTSLSSTLPVVVPLQNSTNNNDLYPPNTSNATIMHGCPLQKFIVKSASHKNSSRKLSRPLLPRQSSDQRDIYPPVHISCAAREAAFFEFSEENIEDSGVIEWYARWTIEAREKYLEKYESLGEWRLFYRWWLQEYDFRCGYDFAGCLNAKNREDIQRIYPGEENRNLVRRIYFITLMYEYLHQHTKMMEDTFKDLHEDIAGHISELIGDFTQHSDPHGAHLCEVYKLVVQATVNAAIQLFNTVTSGISFPYMSPGQALAVANPMIGPKVGKWEQQVTFGLYTWGSFLFSGQTVGYWSTWQHLVEDRINREQPIIVSGAGRGWSGMCASVEGDFQDQSAMNQGRLTSYLSVTFENIREFNRNTSSDVYMGNFVPQPGKPSLMADIISHRKWAGKDSIVSEMEDARPIKHFIRHSTMKQVIAKLITQSNNYMKCTHDEKAPKLCADAKAVRELGVEGYAADRSRFCPHPDTDPTYVCQVNGWYFADDHQHEKPMSGLDTLENFWENEFKFTLEEFMGDVHANFETCGNNCTQTDISKLTFSSDYEEVRGFTLPVCRNDHNQMSDFLKRGPRRYHFPTICGDWRSNETEGFMKAVSMGPDSLAAKERSIEQLWRDRIPRELEGLSPLNYYLALCRHKIRFPDKWKWNTFKDKLHNLKNSVNHFQIPHQHKPCKHCEWVDNSTQGMDEMEANHFFCESRYVWDNILTQQASHIDLMVYPVKRIENLETKCRRWMKKHGGKAPYKTKALWKIDIEDAAKLVWNNFWRVLPFTAPATAMDTVNLITDKEIELD